MSTSEPQPPNDVAPQTEHLVWLIKKSASLLDRFQSEGDIACLSGSILGFEQAVALTPAENTTNPDLRHNLAYAYFQRFMRLGQISDINASIEYWKRALSLTPDQHPLRIDRINNLGMAYLQKFYRTGAVDALDGAILHFDSAVSSTPNDHPILPGLLNNLGNGYSIRFEYFGQLSDIDQAILHQARSVALVPVDDPTRLGWLRNLGTSYTLRFELRGQAEDIDAAIRCLNEVVASTLENDTNRAGRLNNLGSAYQQRFQHLGSVSDIDQSISCLSLAVFLTPESDDQKCTFLNNLGLAYACRYNHLNRVEDATRGLEVLEEAALLSPQNDLVLAIGIAGNLAGLYMIRFNRSASPEDLELVIKHSTYAVSNLPDHHPQKHGLLNNLGIGHRMRFSLEHDTLDYDRAVAYHSQALSLAPQDHPYRHRYLEGLGTAYFAHYQYSQDVESLNRAASYQLMGVELCPEDHPERAGKLMTLSDTALEQARTTHDADAYEVVLILLRNAAMSAASSSVQRFLSAHKLALHLSANFPKRALEGWEIVMELLPSMVWLGHSVMHRYQDISRVSNAISGAVSTAIANQKYGTALEWLESGRSIVWKQILQLRTPVDELHEVDPNLAQELQQISHDLEQAGTIIFDHSKEPTQGDIFSTEQATQQRHRLAQKWDELIQRVRSKPGFDNFLRPSKVEDLVRAAHSSDVVAIHTGESASGALIVRQGATEVEYLPLLEISRQKASTAYNRMRRILGGYITRESTQRKILKSRAPPDNEFRLTLAMIWTDIVKPVLDFLGYEQKTDSDSSLPRITWCAAGPVTFLPLHAAGIYPSDEKIFNYVVSSYTPTLSALLASTKIATEFTGVLAVGQSDTPGQSRLPGASEELAQLSRIIGLDRVECLQGDEATSSGVLSAMETHGWVHLACHASQNSSAPGTSAFYLHDGPLQLSTIMRKSLKHAEFAFLSACQTASGDESLPDEAVHLAAGMLMAGYRTVIATMWSIRDEDAPLVAEKLYAHMMTDGMPDNRKAAEALHIAMKTLRDKVKEDSFASWVPYIHIGV